MRNTLSQAADMLGLKSQSSEHLQVPEFDPRTLGAKDVLLQWESETHQISNTINPKMRKNLMIIAAVVALLFVIMQEFFLILVVASVFFISHALSNMTPQKISYELSNHGVKIGDETFYWHELPQFFFPHNYENVVAIDTLNRLPKRLYVHFHQKDKEKLIQVLSAHTYYLEEPPVTFVDKAYDSLVDKLDLSGKR